MNCPVRAPSLDLAQNHVRLKQDDQQTTCYEPQPPDLGSLVRPSYGNLSPELQPVSPPSYHHPRREPQPSTRIGKYLLIDQLDNSSLYKSVNIETLEEFVCKIVNNEVSQPVLAAHFRLDSHENINEVHEVLLGERCTYVFFPRGYGDLYAYVRARRRLREPEARRLFKQVVAAVAYCHESGVVLRDLKLRKFVFKDQDRTQLKLESLEDAVVLDNDTDGDDSLSDKHGCPAYVSPEILSTNKSYSGKAADAWSLGVMLYTMLVGRYPFHDTEPAVLFAKIRRGHLALPNWLDSRVRCLIYGLLRPDPAERLSADDALAHPWLQTKSYCDDILSNVTDSKLADQLVPDIGVTAPCI